MSPARRKVLEDWPPAFWDNLRKLYLTPRSLREFDKRTTFALPTLRSISCDVPERHLSRLKRFARHGGPCLDDLHGYTDLITPPKRTKNSPETGEGDDMSVKQTMTAFDHHFEQHLQDNGVVMSAAPTPTNKDELIERMGRRRPSLSQTTFSDSDWKDFQQRYPTSLTEAEVISVVLPVLLGWQPKIAHGQNRYFDHLDPILDTEEVRVGPPKPDWYDGHLPGPENHDLRASLGGYMVPCTRDSVPMLPNFFIEVEGKDGDDDVLRLQAIHDGIFGARAMKVVKNFGMDLASTGFDIAGCAIVATLGFGDLDLYVVHTVASTSPVRPEDFHVTLLGGWRLTRFASHFREAAAGLRNLREWAEEQRNAAIREANERLAMMPKSLKRKLGSGTEEDNRKSDITADAKRRRLSKRSTRSKMTSTSSKRLS